MPALGRINDPADIIASVLVQDGEVGDGFFRMLVQCNAYAIDVLLQTLPETYQPMPSYRLCTSDGLPQLTPGLSQKLRFVLEQRSREERDR